MQEERERESVFYHMPYYLETRMYVSSGRDDVERNNKKQKI